MVKELLLKFANTRPLRVIHDNGVPYLERYFLFQLFGFTFYLHRFVGSDPDRGLHDHPWRVAFSLLIYKWYLEDTSYGVKRVRWFNALVGDSLHRVILPNNVDEVWTLFAHSTKNVKSWGFMRHLEDDTYQYKLYHSKHPGSAQWWKYLPRGRSYNRDTKGIAIPVYEA